MARINVPCANCNKTLAIEETQLPVNKAINITCPSCKKAFTYKRKENIIAWLIVHDANAPKQIFPLKLGKVTIGRKKAVSMAEVQIQASDPFMSSSHAEIEIATTDNQTHILFSAKNETTWLQSKQRLYAEDCFYLGDGYVLQIGYTTCILKTASACKDIQAVEDFTRNLPYPAKAVED